MKRFVVLLVIAGLVLTLTTLAYTDDAIKKLGRGVANVITSPFEFTKGIGDAKGQSGYIASFTWGIFQGTVNFIRRAVVGVYEITTFPIPLPGGYRPIITDPEFFLDTHKVERLQ